jgi:GT2 family glycosyltransferase/glycosyltransferase involved in cell wall biosynthesis
MPKSGRHGFAPAAWRQDLPAARHQAPPPDTSRIDYERGQASHAWRQAEGATSPRDACRWLERAYRFTPSDQNLTFSLASARMADANPSGALDLFTKLAARHGGREVLTGLAVCALACGQRDVAHEAVARALSTLVPDRMLLAVAGQIGGAWCGLTRSGRVLGLEQPGEMCHPPRSPRLYALDGYPVHFGDDRLLPDGWRARRTLRVTRDGTDVPGSPIDIQAIIRTEGFVERVRGGIAGWAWYPADPDADPVLRIVQNGQTQTVTATDLSIAFRGTQALARPRGFAIAIDTSRPWRVLGEDGRDLLGSPLGGVARARPAPPPRPGAGVTVVVPVYRGLNQTLACVRAVLATITAADRLVVVNDASPDADLVAALQRLHDDAALTLIAACPAEPGRNLGFPAAANAGIVCAGGSDVVLLNSDTVVFPGWLTTLRGAVHSAPDIGTATPFSNDATIFTYPDPADPTAMPGPAEGAALAQAALRANAGILVDVPTGHGFCLYLRAACLHATGLLRDTLFAQGYGEENDFCERARARGWRHVAVPSVYVAHQGGVSFGTGKNHLLARNGAILNRLHPTYRGRIDAFIAADPLLPARMRLDAARFADAAGGRHCVLLISHDGHGGTARVVRERAAALRALGLRPIVLRGGGGFTDVAEDGGPATPNLRYHLPEDAPALTRLLAAALPLRAELHHLLGHSDDITGVMRGLAIPFDVWVHDYQWICARIALVTGDGKFCGEPPVESCIACVEKWGDAQDVPLSPRDLRSRSVSLLTQAETVVTPSADVSRRIRRHFPLARIRQTGWEADPPHAGARFIGAHRTGVQTGAQAGILTVAVIGAIGMEKGYDVLLACARDAAARALPLRFTLVGFSIDDTPLLATGHVFVTGPFKAADAASTIAGTGAALAFLPSIWPETWCYALSDAWQAGLDAAVFDIGTPAERVRRTGRGWILPLGLPPARVNEALLNLQAPASRSGP